MDIELDTLLVVMEPLGHDHWTLEEVHEVKEQEIVKEMEKLLKAEKKAGKGKKKKDKNENKKDKDDDEGETPTFFSRAKQQLIDHASIRLKVSNVHIRYEQFGNLTGGLSALRQRAARPG